MKRELRNETIKQLKQQGFKLVKGFSYLFVNENGEVYNLNTAKYIKPKGKNYIKPESDLLSVPKLVLQAFAAEPYRENGHIVYLDGNKANLSVQNLKYNRLFLPDQYHEVNPTDLMTSIRCYFEVEKRYTVKDFYQTNQYLKMITENRGFFYLNCRSNYIEVYKTYIASPELINKSITDTAKEHGLAVRDCATIINQFTNQLISDILSDLENGLLSVHEYKPKKTTKTEMLRKYNEQLKANGQEPVPLRKQSLKEKLRAFEKSLSDVEPKNKKPKPKHGK